MEEEEKWAKSIEKTSLWNKFIQNESQSIRLGSILGVTLHPTIS